MNPITTATRDITAFKTLTMNRDHNLGDLVLGENGGLKCVNHHWLWHWQDSKIEDRSNG